MSSRKFVVILLVVLAVITPAAALAEEAADETDQALARELVKLAKFNARFRLEANRHQPWRDYTYPATREAGTALSFTATLIDLKQQVRGLDNLKKIKRNQLKNAVRCGITGNAISAGASAAELAQNTWVMLKARQEGFSPGRSLAFVKEIVADTDRLFDQRDRLAEQEPSAAKRKVIYLETRLAKRIRQQLVFEFGTWSCHSRDRAWRENVFYTLDTLQNLTRMCAGITTMRGFARPKLARPAAVTALVSNSVATVSPIVSTIAGVAIRKYQKQKLERELPFERPHAAPELDDLQEKLSSSPHHDALRRVIALSERSENIDNELGREVKQIENYRKVAQQQLISGPLIGLAGVTSSTLATTAVYGYFRKPRIAVRLGFAGRVTQLTGQSYALWQTPYTTVKGIIKKRQLAARGELPGQIMKARLKRLEEFEKAQEQK